MPILDPHGTGGYAGPGARQGNTAAQINPPPMPAARDHAVADRPFTQPGTHVRTGVLDGEPLGAFPKHRHLAPPDIQATAFPFAEILFPPYFPPPGQQILRLVARCS